MPYAPLIDGLEFARGGQRLADRRIGSSLPRLRDVLLPGESGFVQFELEGIPELQGRPALRLKVHAELALQCQRCLGRLEVALDSAALLLLYAHEAELAMHRVEVDGPEGILATREMPVLALVEDEVLLSIPFAPRHEHCHGQARGAQSASKKPFAALRGLIEGKH